MITLIPVDAEGIIHTAYLVLSHAHVQYIWKHG